MDRECVVGITIRSSSKNGVGIFMLDDITTINIRADYFNIEKLVQTIID